MNNFKKAGFLMLILIMTLTIFTACSTPAATPVPEPEKTTTTSGIGYTDGVYTAQEATFDATTGWKDNATVTIAGGKISSVVLNGTNKDTTLGDKLSAVKAGKYDIVASGEKSPWDVQAKAIEDKIVSSQDTTSMSFDADGKSDAIPEATMSYGHYYDLVNEALAKAKTK